MKEVTQTIYVDVPTGHIIRGTDMYLDGVYYPVKCYYNATRRAKITINLN